MSTLKISTASMDGERLLYSYSGKVSREKGFTNVTVRERFLNKI